MTIGGLVIYVPSFAMGLGPIFWLMISEIYPLKVRGAAISAYRCQLGNEPGSIRDVPEPGRALGRAETFWLYGVIVSPPGSSSIGWCRKPMGKGWNRSKRTCDRASTHGDYEKPESEPMATLLKLTGLSWPELIRAIWRGSVETNVTNRAAELAFWFLLGFFPMLLSVTGMVSMIGSAPGSQGTLMTYVGEVLPSGASSLVRQVLAQTTGSGRAWFSLLFALWSSSSATSGLIDALNAIYGLKESRPWWKSRLIAVGLADCHRRAEDRSVDHCRLWSCSSWATSYPFRQLCMCGTLHNGRLRRCC